MNDDASREMRRDTYRTFLKLAGVEKISLDLEGLRDAFHVLNKHAPSRLSLRQALALLFVLHANASDRIVSMKDVREYFDADDGADGKTGLSVANTFQIFFPESPQEPNGLGWIEQVPDKEDRRKKFLMVTHEGLEVARALSDALRRGRI